MPNFTPSVQCVAAAVRKTPKSASEQLKYWRFALRAMVPVIMAALRSRYGHYIFILWFLLSSIFFLT